MKQLKSGLFSCTGNKVDYCSLLEIAKDMGFQSVELYQYDDLKTADINVAKRIGERAKELNIAICCQSVGLDFVDYNRDEQIAKGKAFVDVAQAAGSPSIQFSLFGDLKQRKEGLPLGKLLAYLAPAVREICAYAADHGVACLCENQGFYMNGIEPMERLLEAVDHPNFGLVADLGNILFVGETPERYVGYFAPVIKHVHVKNFLRWRDENDGAKPEGWILSRAGEYLFKTELRKGFVDLKKSFRILEAAGYEGWYAIENTLLNRREQMQDDLNFMVEEYQKALR